MSQTGPGARPDFEDLVRRALDVEASRVEIAPDALGTIRDRIAASRARWWLPRTRSHRPSGGIMLALSSGAAAVLVAAVITVGSCAPTTDSPGPTTGHPATTPATRATSPTASPTGAATTASVPVYYLGSQQGEPRLYREYHNTPVGDGSTAARVKAAIELMLDGRTAYDPDYSSQWPASASVAGVTVAGGVATVDLHGATVNADDPVGNRAALQQLIWTATAYTGATGVRLLFDGAPRATLWKAKLPVAGTLHRAAAVATLADVWVIDPQQGAVTGTHVTINLAGIVFEATIQVRIRNASGTVVFHRTGVLLSAGAPDQGTTTITTTLAPGTYTVEAFELSAKDGSLVSLDSHEFTVK